MQLLLASTDVFAEEIKNYWPRNEVRFLCFLQKFSSPPDLEDVYGGVTSH